MSNSKGLADVSDTVQRRDRPTDSDRLRTEERQSFAVTRGRLWRLSTGVWQSSEEDSSLSDPSALTFPVQSTLCPVGLVNRRLTVAGGGLFTQ